MQKTAERKLDDFRRVKLLSGLHVGFNQVISLVSQQFAIMAEENGPPQEFPENQAWYRLES